MKYMLLFARADTVRLSPEEDDAAMQATRQWVRAMTARRVYLDGDRLRPPSEARTVQVRQGQVLVTDGPFAETKEQIGGYDLVECADMEEALEVASRHPFAQFGSIEVRPLWPLPL
jgi:hypothetical protein